MMEELIQGFVTRMTAIVDIPMILTPLRQSKVTPLS
jgi:hypothetical protein